LCLFSRQGVDFAAVSVYSTSIVAGGKPLVAIGLSGPNFEKCERLRQHRSPNLEKGW